MMYNIYVEPKICLDGAEETQNSTNNFSTNCEI